MTFKNVCIVLCAFAYCKAGGQDIRRIMPDAAITASQYFKPKKADNKTADGIITKGLEGCKWKTQSAVIAFRINGLHSIDWDNGSKDFGGWSVNNRVLKFVIFKGEDEFDGSEDDIQYYFIISFDGKKMEYQALTAGGKDAAILVATKQVNQ